jgi:hypothetical protein
MSTSDSSTGEARRIIALKTKIARVDVRCYSKDVKMGQNISRKDAKTHKKSREKKIVVAIGLCSLRISSYAALRETFFRFQTSTT